MIAVFVPSIMGVGVIVSIGVVVADVARRVVPGGDLRSIRRRRQRAIAFAAPIAEAARRAGPSMPALRRRRRSRATYAAVAVVGAALAVYVALGSMFNYLRQGGYLYDKLWVLLASLLASTMFLAVGIVAGVAAVRFDSPPAWLRRVIAVTPFGAVDVGSLRRARQPRPLRARRSHGPDDAVASLDHALDAGRTVVALPPPGVGDQQLADIRAHHADLDRLGVQLIVVAPRGERHRLERRLAPLAITSDPDGRLLAHLGLIPLEPPELLVLLVEPDGRVSWQRRQRRSAAFPARTLARVVRRRNPAVLSPSDVLTPAMATAIGAVFALLAVLAFAADGALLSWDEPVRDRIIGIGGERFGTWMRWVSRLGSRLVLVPLAVPIVIASWNRCRRFAITFASALPAGLLLELTLKWLVDRPRPPFALGFGASFPSGHVVASVAFWGLVPPFALLMTRRRAVWLAGVAVSAATISLVGISRVYLGAHWPSDVVGGLLVGSLFLVVAEWAIHNPAPRPHAAQCPLHPPRRDRPVLEASGHGSSPSGEAP